MILRLFPAFKKLFAWQAFVIVYTLAWLLLLVFAWRNWELFSIGPKIAVSVFLVLTTPAISDLRKSE